MGELHAAGILADFGAIVAYFRRIRAFKPSTA
jgi:hypothetical protein